MLIVDMIQELLLVASAGILSRLPDSAHDGSRDVLVRHLGQVREQSSSYLRKVSVCVGRRTKLNPSDATRSKESSRMINSLLD